MGSFAFSRSMLFIGPAGYPPGSKDVVDAVRRTHGLGLNALEVQFVRNVHMAEDKAHDARILAERLGVREEVRRIMAGLGRRAAASIRSLDVDDRRRAALLSVLAHGLSRRS